MRDGGVAEHLAQSLDVDLEQLLAGHFRAPVPQVPAEQLEHLEQAYKAKREAILSDEFTGHEAKTRKLHAAKADAVSYLG